MIFVSLIFLCFGVYTLFSSSDTLDMARACFRIVVVLVWIACERFSEFVALHGIVLAFVILSAALLAFVRMEVQVDHDRN